MNIEQVEQAEIQFADRGASQAHSIRAPLTTADFSGFLDPVPN